MCWNVTVISILERKKQEEQDFKASVGYTVVVGAQPGLHETLSEREKRVAD